MDYLSILYGVSGGIGWSILGFVKNRGKSGKESFDVKRFVKTAIIGAIAGGVIGYMELPLSDEVLTEYATMVASIGLIDTAINTILNWIQRKK